MVLAAAAGVAGAATTPDSVTARRGWLGVYTEALSQPMLVALDIGHGVLVTEVAKESPAARAGIETGDVILEIDGEPTHDPADLKYLVRERPAQTVDVALRHKGKDKHVSAVLESRPSTSEVLDFGWPGVPAEALREAGKALREVGPRAKALAQESRGPALDSLRHQLDELRQEIRELRDELRRKGKGN